MKKTKKRDWKDKLLCLLGFHDYEEFLPSHKEWRGNSDEIIDIVISRCVCGAKKIIKNIKT